MIYNKIKLFNIKYFKYIKLEFKYKMNILIINNNI